MSFHLQAIDIESDLRWLREQAILKTIDPADVISVLHDMIEAEGQDDLTRHPFYGLVAYALELSPTPPQYLQERLQRLVQAALDAVVDERMAEED